MYEVNRTLEKSDSKSRINIKLLHLQLTKQNQDGSIKNINGTRKGTLKIGEPFDFYYIKA